MKKLGFISILLVLLPLASQAEDCVFNLMAQGWGFNDGEEIGDHWGVVGLLEPIQPENPPIDFDFVANEVSFAILDMERNNATGTDIAIFELGGGVWASMRIHLSISILEAIRLTGLSLPPMGPWP